jgi:AraC-like DNA-binding protein
MKQVSTSVVLERQVSQLVERINALIETMRAEGVPRMALTIDEAATAVAMSSSQFRRIFLDGKLVRSVPMGDRARAIDIDELRAAYQRYKEETRAN